MILTSAPVSSLRVSPRPTALRSAGRGILHLVIDRFGRTVLTPYVQPGELVVPIEQRRAA